MTLSAKRAISAFVSLALMVAAPGLPCYTALAQVAKPTASLGGKSAGVFPRAPSAIAAFNLPASAINQRFPLTRLTPSRSTPSPTPYSRSFSIAPDHSAGQSNLKSQNISAPESIGGAGLDQIRKNPPAEKSSQWQSGPAVVLGWIFDKFKPVAPEDNSVEPLPRSEGTARPTLGAAGPAAPAYRQQPPAPAAQAIARDPYRPAALLGAVETISLGVWEKLAGLFRVFPDKEQNRQFWIFVAGQALIVMGISFQHTALPNLAESGKVGSSHLDRVLTVDETAQGAASIFTGHLADRTSIMKMLVWPNLIRSVLLMALPVVLIQGAWSSAALIAIICATGFFQGMGAVVGPVALNQVLSDSDAHYNKANAVYYLVVGLAGILGPLVAGSFIGIMNIQFGNLLAGSALCFGVSSILIFAVALGYAAFFRVPQDRVELARAKANLNARVQGVMAAQIEGFRLIWKSRFLRLTLLYSTGYKLMGHAFLLAALTRYIQDVLGAADLSASGLSEIPGLGLIISGLMSKAGIVGLYLAASRLGETLSSLWVWMGETPQLDLPSWFPAKLRSFYSVLSPLERLGFWSSIVSGFGALGYWGVFFSSGRPVSAGALFGVAFLQGFATLIWNGLNQKEIQENYSESMGKIYASKALYETICSIAGLFFFSWLMANFTTTMALGIICVLFSVFGGSEIVESFHVLPVRGPKS